MFLIWGSCFIETASFFFIPDAIEIITGKFWLFTYFKLKEILSILDLYGNSFTMEIKQHVAISESGLIFNPVTGDSFTVNPIGLDILKFLKEKKNYEEIQDYILSKYDTDTEIFKRDYQDFLSCLRSYDLIKDL